VWPYASWDRAPVYDEKAKKWKEGAWIDDAQKQKIITVRVARGPLELVAYYDGPQSLEQKAPRRTEVREAWNQWTLPLAGMTQLTFTPPTVLPDYSLAGTIIRREGDLPLGWRYLIESESANIVRERFGMVRRPALAPPGPGGRPTPIPRGGLSPQAGPK
jgi:hypothetical protein